MDRFGDPILWVSLPLPTCSRHPHGTQGQLRRPFAWINSRMFVQRLHDFNQYTHEGEPVLDTFAEVQQRWHLWCRRYDLFLR